MRNRILGVAIVLLMTCVAGAAPATRPAPMIGEMRVQKVKGFTLLYASEKTTFEKIREPIVKNIALLQAAQAQGKAKMSGAMVLAYHDVMDMSKPFVLDVGMMVTPDTQGVGTLKVKELPGWQCATVLLTGSIANLGDAYGKLMGEIAKAGLTPTGESRELYLYWEGEDSTNNVIQIQVEVK